MRTDHGNKAEKNDANYLQHNINKQAISYYTAITMGIKGLAKLLSDEAPDCIRDVSDAISVKVQ